MLAEQHDADLAGRRRGLPAWLPDGRLVSVADIFDVRRLVLGEQVVDLGDVQVSHVVAVGGDGVLVAGTDEPTEGHLWLVSADGTAVRLTEPGGYHVGTGAGGTLVVARRTLETSGVRVDVRRAGVPAASIASHTAKPVITAAPRLMRVGEHDLCVGVLLPRDHLAGDPLPVLMDPYGGPHHQEVVAMHDRWLESQWLADQGFAVVVADGRGTARVVRPGTAACTTRWPPSRSTTRSRRCRRWRRRCLSSISSRVAIRGWSYGGYLAALAVLRRPDVFHAAVAGAPVTDARLYDTFYSERYLGDPTSQPEVYDRNSLLVDTPALTRPLLLIHGLADDNVVVAHSLRLSSILLAAGAPHDVLPLSGVTHMTPQEVVAENLLRLQVEWLHRALARTP